MALCMFVQNQIIHLCVSEKRMVYYTMSRNRTGVADIDT